jgi:predicted transcriptional regulator
VKLKRAKIVVQSAGEVKKEWEAALRGKLTSLQAKNEVVFLTLESVAKILTKARLELMAAIIRTQPKSIYALAKAVRRDFKNVHSDVRLLSELGFVELRAEGRPATLMPVARYSGFEVNLAA